MDASQRVRSIRAISNALAAEDMDDIDLTLSQFDCPTDPSWSDSRKRYVVRMVRDQPDTVLNALAQHLSLVLDEHADEYPAPDLWTDGYFRLFVSHLATEKAYAHELKTALAEFAISGFVAHDDIAPSVEWIKEIERALFSADGLVALIHDGFVNSSWTDQEVGAVMGRHRPIIAAKFDVDPHGFLGQFQAIPGNEAPLVAARIFDVLAARDDTKRAVAYAVVHRTENGTGHHDNQHNFDLLRKIKYFDDAIAARLRLAMDESHYVAAAYNKEGVMQELFDQWGYELSSGSA